MATHLVALAHATAPRLAVPATGVTAPGMPLVIWTITPGLGRRGSQALTNPTQLGYCPTHARRAAAVAASAAVLRNVGATRLAHQS